MVLAVPPPLEPAWEHVLAAALSRPVTPRALGVMVERQAARYRGEPVPLARGDELAARALFWFPRDVQKVALAVAELSLAGALPPRPLRVLDLGAGLGATSLGLARALPPGASLASVTALDRDADALALLRAIAREAARAGLLPAIPELTVLARDLTGPSWSSGLGEYDLVLAGNALVELTRGLGEPPARGEALAGHLEALLSHLAPDGALIALEPASRDESRALHHARDALCARGVTVFSPCPHARPCPALASPRDWCHEDLDGVDLPPWLVPVARSAGLRYEGLTFAQLVLRRDGRTLAARLARAGTVPLRLTSRPLSTRGKTEALGCADAPAPTTGFVRLMELQRHARAHGGPALARRARGDLLSLPPEVFTRGEEGRPVRLLPEEVRDGANGEGASTDPGGDLATERR